MKKDTKKGPANKVHLIRYDNKLVRIITRFYGYSIVVFCICAYFNWIGIRDVFLFFAGLFLVILLYYVIKGFWFRNQVIALTSSGITLPRKSEEIRWEDIWYMKFSYMGKSTSYMMIVLHQDHTKIKFYDYEYFCPDKMQLARMIEETAERRLFTSEWTIYCGKKKFR